MTLVSFRRRAELLLAVVLAASGLAACGVGSTSAAGGQSPADVLTIPEQVGVPPYSFIAENGDLTGLLPDLSIALGNAMGVKVKNEQASFENSLLGLQRGTYAWVPGADVTAERLKRFDFATTLVESYGFRVKNGAADIGTSMDSLCGLSIAVTAGSSPIPVLQNQAASCKASGKPPIDVQTFADQATADLAVKSGRANAVTATTSGLAYQLTIEPNVWKVTGPTYQSIDIGFASMKGDGMAQKLEAATDKIIQDGTYGRILAKYHAERMGITHSVFNPEPHS